MDVNDIIWDKHENLLKSNYDIFFNSKEIIDKIYTDNYNTFVGTHVITSEKIEYIAFVICNQLQVMIIF